MVAADRQSATLWVSNDNGLHWQQSGVAMAIGFDQQMPAQGDCAFNGQSIACLAVNDKNELISISSDNNGVSWQMSAAITPYSPKTEANLINVEGLFYLSYSNGEDPKLSNVELLVSADNAHTWQSIGGDLSMLTGSDYGYIEKGGLRNIAGRLYVNILLAPDMDVGKASIGIYELNNKQALIPVNDITLPHDALSGHFKLLGELNDRLFALVYQGNLFDNEAPTSIVWSVDNGNTWQLMSGVGDPQFFNASNMFLLGSTPYVVANSEDVTALSRLPRLTANGFTKMGDSIYRAGDDGIYASKDYGITWDALIDLTADSGGITSYALKSINDDDLALALTTAAGDFICRYDQSQAMIVGRYALAIDNNDYKIIDDGNFELTPDQCHFDILYPDDEMIYGYLSPNTLQATGIKAVSGYQILRDDSNTVFSAMPVDKINIKADDAIEKIAIVENSDNTLTFIVDGNQIKNCRFSQLSEVKKVVAYNSMNNLYILSSDSLYHMDLSKVTALNNQCGDIQATKIETPTDMKLQDMTIYNDAMVLVSATSANMQVKSMNDVETNTGAWTVSYVGFPLNSATAISPITNQLIYVTSGGSDAIAGALINH
ncbi:hypothetical protein [Cysteiniphilum sp. JM-1]|uniref:hypothetical protein n=1 Tax=Cysteiniphilum sp. JM-1 TaxID=2610891 RepID=UPI0012468D98|nr:hypothetical protein [Cysteiniphilum sp. JM-1]